MRGTGTASNMAEQFLWNEDSVREDFKLFVRAVNSLMHEEITWPSSDERRRLGTLLDDFQGCIGFIDGTNHEIQSPTQNQRAYYDFKHTMHSLLHLVCCSVML